MSKLNSIWKLNYIHSKLSNRVWKWSNIAWDLTFKMLKQIERIINNPEKELGLGWIEESLYLPEIIFSDINKDIFFQKMLWIYNKIKTDNLNDWINPIPLNETKWGYIIAYRYDNSFTDKICNFSEQIRKIAPSIIYDEKNIHTTLLTTELSKDFYPNQDDLLLIINSINEIKDFIYKTNINFWINEFNSNSWLITWIPWINFLSNSQYIHESIKNKWKNLWLLLPWWWHITTHRFTEKVSYKTLKEKWFFELVNNQMPFWKQIPTWIDIWYFFMDTTWFKLEVVESIKF
jgi:hypothetical protein